MYHCIMEKDNKKLVRDVYDRCNVYPLPDNNRVEEEVKKVKNIMSCATRNEPSDRRVAKRVSKALDLRTKINDDEWIEYDGKRFELKD